MKYAVATAAIAATTMIASAGGTIVAQYELGDHPGGNENPPPYGLRLDNILGAGVATFSIDFHDDTTLTVYDDGGSLSINISGTLFGGLTDGSGGYISASSYAVDFTYGASVAASGGGWVVDGFSTANSGTMTSLVTSDVITLYGKTNNADENFLFLPDGHRIDGDDSAWVGRGWLTPNDDGSAPHGGGSQDWLFTANPVPAPGTLAFAGLLGFGATRRRR